MSMIKFQGADFIDLFGKSSRVPVLKYNQIFQHDNKSGGIYDEYGAETVGGIFLQCLLLRAIVLAVDC